MTAAPYTAFTTIFRRHDLSSITCVSATATAMKAMKTASANQGAD
ncbi:MAG: hypothetical protein R3D52_07305 [Xanthobacteraceae bacterium]